jgi:hypothetical protein
MKLYSLVLLLIATNASEIKLKKSVEPLDPSFKLDSIKKKLKIKGQSKYLFDSHTHRKVGTFDFSNFYNLHGTGSKQMFDRAYTNLKHSRPMVQADSTIDVANYLNLQYTGPAYFGS